MVEVAGIGSKWISNVYIKPSVLDIGQTEGLCGTLTGTTTDDFIAKGETTPDPASCDGLGYVGSETNQDKTDNFANSWRYSQFDSGSFIEFKNLINDNHFYHSKQKAIYIW